MTGDLARLRAAELVALIEGGGNVLCGCPDAIDRDMGVIERALRQYVASRDVPAPKADAEKMIDMLTDREGDSVTFCAPNADFNGMPNECVTVNASWTEWEDRDFRADTRTQCLTDAVNAMRAAGGLPALTDPQGREA